MKPRELTYLTDVIDGVTKALDGAVIEPLAEVGRRRSPERLAAMTGIHPDDILIQDMRKELTALSGAVAEAKRKLNVLSETVAVANQRFH